MEVSEFLEKLSPDEKRWLEFAVDKDWRLQVTNPKVVRYNPTLVAIDFFNPRLMKDERWNYFALYPINGLDYFVFGDDCAHKYKDNGWVRNDGKQQDSLPVVPTFKWICVERPDENGELCGQVIAMVPVCENIEDMFAYMTYMKDTMGNHIGLGKDNGDAKIAAICFQLVTLFHFREKHYAFRFYINHEKNILSSHLGDAVAYDAVSQRPRKEILYAC